MKVRLHMSHRTMSNFAGVILDLDGVIWVSGSLSQSAGYLIETLQTFRIPFCVLTNDCTCSSAQRREQLRRAGLVLSPNELVTAPMVTRDWLLKQGYSTIRYLGRVEALEDLEPIIVVAQGPADAVVIGDLFDTYSRRDLEEAAAMIMGGTPFIAMQRKRTWADGSNRYIDNGFWIAGMEFVTSVQADIVGKPNSVAYQSAFDRLGVSETLKASVVMISDDLEVDLFGAKQFGLATVYVGSGLEDQPQWLDLCVKDLNCLAREIREAANGGK
ncbi:MAG TPA: HAD hydrolase-like protein [Anaerolineales bacterium]|nr:HAD hydrolase-like protein [Anaerolineales bacterium]